MASQMLPADIEKAVQALLKQQLADLLPDDNVSSLGAKDIDDNDQLVFQTPCVRTRYIGVGYKPLHDNIALAYQAPHVVEIWCADEDLRGKEEQREASKALIGKVAAVLAGARIPLSDGSTSDPILLLGIAPLLQDIIGSVYILTVQVNGIAQFPGANG